MYDFMVSAVRTTPKWRVHFDDERGEDRYVTLRAESRVAAEREAQRRWPDRVFTFTSFKCDCGC